MGKPLYSEMTLNQRVAINVSDTEHVIKTVLERLTGETVGKKVVLKRGQYKGRHATVSHVVYGGFIHFFVQIPYNEGRDGFFEDLGRGYRMSELEFLS